MNSQADTRSLLEADLAGEPIHPVLNGLSVSALNFNSMLSGRGQTMNSPADTKSRLEADSAGKLIQPVLNT